jgi:hypothetical protein
MWMWGKALIDQFYHCFAPTSQATHRRRPSELRN